MVKKAKGEMPDWLRPKEELPQGESCCPPPRKRKPRDTDDEQLDDGKPPPPKKGIKCGPILLLMMLVVPTAAPLLIDVISKFGNIGFLVPDVRKWARGNTYRPCLIEYYADWAPDKLGNVDSNLQSWEGREKQLFAKLHKKYGKKANLAKCIPPRS